MTEPELMEKLAGVENWLLPGQAFFLHQKVLALSEDATILEIGCFRGYSTLAMALACIGTSRKIFVIDVNAAYLEDARTAWARAGVEAYITAFQIDSWLLPTLALGVDKIPPLDFAFIDGSHEFLDVAADVRNVLVMMKPGGAIALHDVTEGWPEVKLVWDTIARNFRHTEQCSTLAYGELKL